MDMTLKIPNTNPNTQASIDLLPVTIPAGSLASQLAAIYGFTEDDVEIVWRPSQAAVGEGLNSIEEECSVCESSELPIDTTQDSFKYLYWLAVVRSLAAGRDWAVDALTTSTSTFARRRTSRGSANTNAPATIPPQPTQPLPSPTFVPSNTPIKLDKSLLNAFTFKGKSLAANPPEEDCEDDTNPVLVYDRETEEMTWECRKEGEGSGSGCCQLIQITRPPSAGFGVGVGKIITGVDSDGTYILGEEVPVVIPSLTY